MCDILRPMGVAYYGASMVIATIDAMATVLTGERDFFALGGSVDTYRAKAIWHRLKKSHPVDDQLLVGCSCARRDGEPSARVVNEHHRALSGTRRFARFATI